MLDCLMLDPVKLIAESAIWNRDVNKSFRLFLSTLELSYTAKRDLFLKAHKKNKVFLIKKWLQTFLFSYMRRGLFQETL